MIALVLAGLVGLALALGLLLWPLLRERRIARAGRADARLAVIASARKQIDTAHAAGEIDAAEHASRLETLYAQADAVLQQQPDAAPPPARPWPAALALAIVLPLGVIASYVTIGAPGSLLPGGSSGTGMAQATPDPAEEQLRTAELADRLAERLASDKEATAEAWVLLARTYRSAGLADQAAAAYREAAAREAQPADILVEHASLVIDRQDKRFDAEADALVAAALARDADNLNALAMAGASAYQSGDRALALRHWQRLESLVPEGSEDRQRAAALVARARGEPVPPGAFQPAADVPAGATTMVAANPGAGLPAQHPPLASTGQAPAAAAAITGRVELSDALRARVPGGAWLFVFARAEGGMPLPIAAARSSPSAWPAEFRLDDGNSMIEGRKLSGFERVRLVARISASGNATRQPGDLEGTIDGVALGQQGVRLVVDRVVE